MERRSCNKSMKSSRANWSDLPQELVECISRKIESMQDFVTFGAVCKSWSSAATKENFTRGLTHQVPLLMLPCTKDKSNPIPVKCYNLTNGKVSKLNLPKIATHHRLIPFCLSSLGWLMIIALSRRIYLLHPFTQEEIKLPIFQFGSITKFVLSSSPSLTSDYIVMVSSISYSGREFAFWSPKNNQWTRISSELDASSDDSDIRLYDIAYYKGQFYILNSYGNVLVCDIDDPKKAATKVVVSGSPTHVVSRNSKQQWYLVESGEALLLVFRLKYTENFGFRVFEVPLSSGNWLNAKEVKNLGNRALFLSCSNASISIEVSGGYSRFKANCIYCAIHLSPDFVPSQIEPICFSMEDRKVERFIPKSIGVQTPYVWTQRTF